MLVAIQQPCENLRGVASFHGPSLILPDTMASKAPHQYEVRFEGPGISPENVPLRAVTDTLSALQDLAAGRDPFVTSKVPPEKGIGLVDVQQGSARYQFVAHDPQLALDNFDRIGRFLSDPSEQEPDNEHLLAALSPLRGLSDVARSVGVTLSVIRLEMAAAPLFTIDQETYGRVSADLFMEGNSTVIGEVVRAGGATGMRCLLRVPGRRKILYCDVASEQLVRRLGQHLYENIVATGKARWLHRAWRLVAFTINDFSQPRFTSASSAISELRTAGLRAWDAIENPEDFLRGEAE